MPTTWLEVRLPPFFYHFLSAHRRLLSFSQLWSSAVSLPRPPFHLLSLDLSSSPFLAGIPYPNSQSAELKERMAYLKATAQPGRLTNGPDPGQVLCTFIPPSFLPSPDDLHSSCRPKPRLPSRQPIHRCASPFPRILASCSRLFSVAGRAIRNARDWASIILLDDRYTQPSKRAQLPAWLGKDVQTPASFGALIAGLAKFSRTRRTAAAAVV